MKINSLRSLDKDSEMSNYSKESLKKSDEYMLIENKTLKKSIPKWSNFRSRQEIHRNSAQTSTKGKALDIVNKFFGGIITS